jgi:hypothetical protein
MNATPADPHSSHSELARASSGLICWTRMQAESGQELTSIIERKELERRAGNGLFFWGVGNAPARTTAALARTRQEIDVVFSVMRSRPKSEDAAPGSIVLWRRYVDAFGVEQPFPPHALVTSRGDTRRGRKQVHFVLVCRSVEPLALGNHGPFDHRAYRNASGNGRPIGASQVTALVRRVEQERPTGDYQINMRARLAESYWVKLTDPIPMRRKSTLLWPGGYDRKAP